MRLLILGAMAMISVPGLGSAQSVLERVIEQIDGASNLAQVNGVYANISENIGTVMMPMEVPTESQAIAPDFLDEGVKVGRIVLSGDGGISAWISVYSNNAGTGEQTVDRDVGSVTYKVNSDLTVEILSFTPSGKTGSVQIQDYERNILAEGETPSASLVVPGAIVMGGAEGELAYRVPDGDTSFVAIGPLFTDAAQTIYVPVSATIDGSITNIITGVTAVTQEAVAGAATATDFNIPTFDLGDMATTALGAVNTGEITLGVNAAVDEASTSTTNAIAAVMTQIGGSADTGALVLNVASNASQVNGSIENTLVAINGTIGNLSTTALGAVNTGTITSGVDAAVAGIVGTAGQ